MSNLSVPTNSINKDIKLDQNNDPLICPKCKLIPKIYLNELTNEITYVCASSDSKKHKKTTYPLNYFNINQNLLNKNNININIKCSLHNKKYIYYCNKCEFNLCTDCINSNDIKKIDNKNKHYEHDIIELKLISPTGSNINKKKRILESIKKNLNKANLIFEEYISKIKQIWNKIYKVQNNLIEYKQKIIETYIQMENNYNSINNLNQIFNQIKFINKPFDFLTEVILNESTKNIINKINDIFKIKNYGSSNLDEMNIEEVFEENRNNNLNNSTSTQKQFAIVKTMLNVKMNENNNSRLLKEYLICGLSSGILKIYDTAPKFIFKKNIYLNYNKEGFCCNKEINYILEIYNNIHEDENIINDEYIRKKNKLYLLICSNDLDIIEISNNFEYYNFIQKIGEESCVYDKCLFISYRNNQYILAYSNWLTFLNLYKKNKNKKDNSYNLLTKLLNSEEVCVSFIEGNHKDNYIEILCANCIDSDDDFYIAFYKIFNDENIKEKTKGIEIKENNIKKIKVPSFINDQDCLVKINPHMGALIIGKYVNDYLNYENINDNNNKNINGILLLDLINKQIISIIESKYYISKIFLISGGLLIYNSKEKKINLLKYYEPSNKYPELFLKEKNKFFFNSDNFEFCIDDSYEELYNDNSKNIMNENSNEYELILVTELKGGLLAIAKNQKIIVYK